MPTSLKIGPITKYTSSNQVLVVVQRVNSAIHWVNPMDEIHKNVPYKVDNIIHSSYNFELDSFIHTLYNFA